MSKTIEPQSSCKIAVIGLGCVYPGAGSPLQLWENILVRRRQFREMPDVRLPNKDYYDPDPLTPNKTYQNKAAVIDGYEFNWLEKRIPKQTFESTDIVHWLALDTALQAIKDAGYDKNNIPTEKTGVILGNTLTGEFTRSNQMLLRWPFVRKALRESARKKGLTGIAEELESTMEQYYKSVFHPVTEDTLAGGLANTIAGRVCNYLDFHGGGYIVDGACSSSMLAIVTAANYLELQQMDMVIAGGVDISLDTFELVGFAKTNALTPDEMRVYDKNGKGFLPGEGCGMVVLKRLPDAIRDGNQIYAVIDGWGISSDGKGGITAPSAAGQSRALIRAHEKAGLNPEKIDFIEGHGTGTTVGDKVELEAISIALNKAGNIPARNCGVTSFKSIVGHTKAAAGIGAFIKAAIAVNRRILPPTAGLKDPNPIFNELARSLYPITHGQVKDPESILYAGVSAMGFGGINSHVIIHSAGEPSQKLQPSIEEKKLIASSQSHELFLFTASDKTDLIEKLIKATTLAEGMSYAEMTDFAFLQNSIIDTNPKLRAAVIADTPFELKRKINTLVDRLKDWDEKGSIQMENNTMVAGFKKDNLRIGAVFPGQGSQKVNMARKLTEKFDWAQSTMEAAGDLLMNEGVTNVISSIFRNTERTIDKEQLLLWKEELKQTNVAQPAISLASLLWHEYLTRLGVKIHCVSGHSLGELMAFYAAGLISKDTLIKFSAFRGRSMAENGSGTMASLQCTADKAKKYIDSAEGYVTIANINGPEQTVISGEKATIMQIVQMAKDDQIGAVELPVSAAFHSKLIAEVARDIAAYEVLKEKNPKNPAITLISSINGNEIPDNVDLNSYFAEQATGRVDFISTVHALRDHCDIILEIGPGRVLTGLISNISDQVKAFPVEISADDDLSLNVMLGNIFVSGCDINTEELYKNRLIRPFIPAIQKKFLVNPLERPFPEIEDIQPVQQHSIHDVLKLHSGSDFTIYLKERSAFIREIIDADFKYFRKLRVEEIIPDSGKSLPVPSNHVVVEFQNNNLEVRKLLYDRIQAITGFDPKFFNDQMRLLDDFNLDSIKAASLINGIAKTLGIAGKINASVLSNASLDEILAGLNKVLAISEIPPIREKTPEKYTSPDFETEVYEELAKRTGFPREALSGEHKLLDDLNMDSIKAGAFISHLLKKFEIQKKSNPSTLSNASINDVIKLLTENAAVVKTETKTEEDYSTSWVNAYSVVLTKEPLTIETSRYNEFWKEKSIVIVYAEDQEKQASLLGNQMKQEAARVTCVSGNDLHLLTSFENCCLLVLVPDDTLSGKSIQKTVKLLTDIAHHLDEMSLIGFLQFNDGLFLRESIPGSCTNACSGVVSFAASLHHERPELKIRVVEIDKMMPAEQVTTVFMQEFIGEASFDAAGYDLSGIRRKMKYQLSSHESAKKILSADLGSEDVVIATGGGRGITAECMFALAQKTGCKTALIGSSSKSSETENILARYKANNIVVQYYVCDISDAAAVKATVQIIRNELGTISALFHGAGRNIPRRTEKVTFEEAMAEIAPKLTGFLNLSDALKDCDIRYFIALTSIIGVTGMPGNSWYAFSNENLDLYVRTLQGNSKTKIRTIAYSIWDEIGMGARMGSNQVLSEMGIGSIEPASGISEFMFWLEHESTDQQMVVSSKMGGLDTWDVVKPEMPSKRFISGIKSYEPGRELTARVQLSRATDIYLDDHNYNGSLLFPTVFGLEAMAQASCYLARMPQPAGITIENISLRRPVVVPFEGDMEIGISARVMEADPNNENRVRIFAGISTEDSDFKVFHFSAEFTIHGKPEEIIKSVNLPDKFLTINPQTDLYSWLLFQGPRFQNIDKIYTLDKDRADFRTVKTRRDPENDCFAGEFRSPLIIGNPLLRDVLLQSVQLYLTKKKYLPVFIKRWDIFDIQKQGDGGVVLSNLSEISEDRALCNVELVSGDRVIERISGYEVKALESTPDYPDPKILSDLQTVYSRVTEHEFSRYEPFLDRRIYYKLHKHEADFNKTTIKTRHEIEQGVFQSMIKEIQGIDQSCNIIWAANGKPSIANSNLKLSVSHSQSALFITAGEEEQGCDIEFVCKRTQKEWDDLLENKFTAVLEQLRIIDKNDDLSCTRIWCVREALIKSFGMVPMNITIEKVIHSGIIFKALTAHGENKMVLTFPVELLPENTAILSAVVSLKKEDPSPEKNSSSEKFQAATSFNSDNNAFSDTFFTTFRDCRGFYGKTHFTSFVDWMGALRELVLTPIGTELLKDLSSGQFGMVTNTSEIDVRHEAGALDEITGNLWITNQSDLQNSLIDLNFSFCKNTGDKKIILAECRLSTTWVSIEGRGIVKKSPIPDYFRKFLTEHICTTENKKGIFSRNGYPVSGDLGKNIYHSNNQLRPVVKIREKEFTTGMTHGNTVGNLYYSNYYLWQSRMIEDYLYQHEPGIMTNGGKSGEFLTLHSAVNHLQEAMPFEAVLVTMYIQEYYENGLKFYFEYHCLNEKTMRKLAYGTNTVVFCSRLNELSAPLVKTLPGSLANEVVKVVF